MRVFTNAWFRKFARKERISDAVLCDAVARADAGLIDADLGAGLVKQRVARPGSGRSGGYRTILIYRTATRAVFVYGFAKSDRGNLGAEDERDLKALARPILLAAETDMDRLVAAGVLAEVICDA